MNDSTLTRKPRKINVVVAQDTGEMLDELCSKYGESTSVTVRRLIREYSTWQVITNTPESVLKALEIEARFKTSFWDALILQAAEEADAPILYSEDLATGQRYGAIRVVNPLVELKSS